MRHHWDEQKEEIEIPLLHRIVIFKGLLCYLSWWTLRRSTALRFGYLLMLNLYSVNRVVRTLTETRTVYLGNVKITWLLPTSFLLPQTTTQCTESWTAAVRPPASGAALHWLVFCEWLSYTTRTNQYLNSYELHKYLQEWEHCHWLKLFPRQKIDCRPWRRDEKQFLDPNGQGVSHADSTCMQKS